jgi:hypothetical protein
MGRARDLANILSSSGNVALDSELGLSLITPTSVATTGGSNSISTTGAVSFTSASAISLNGCFSSTYDNYRINFQTTTISTGSDVDLLLYGRSNGVNTTTSTVSERIVQWSTTITGGETTNGRFGASSNTYSNFSQYSIEIKAPFLSQRTIWNSSGSYVSNGGVPYQVLIMGYVDLSTSFDGITFYPSSGTITGTVRIYGYRN